ncbi:MAG: AEC family transporter [Proteobacteria bacterium]|nr:AEC family transporter [Pseudomonadota bacterium]
MHQTILAFFFIIASGLIFRIVKPGDLTADELRRSINTAVFNLFLPALCLKVMSKAPLSYDTILVPLNAYLTLGFMIIFNFIFFKYLKNIFNLTNKEIGALILTSTFGNTTYLGLPVITGLYGEQTARYVLYYDLLATTPFLWTVGARFSAYFGGERSPSVYETIKKLLTLPPLWGIFIGIFINISGLPMPFFIFKALDLLGSVVVPLMIFSIGLSLSFIRPGHTFTIIPVCIFKLLVSPLIGYFLGKIMGLSSLTLNIVTLEAGMPSMVLSLLVASVFGLDVTLTAFAIVITTLLSFITLPLILTVIGG